MSAVSLKVIEAQTGEQPVATVMVMHGLGADGNDFVPIVQQLDLQAIGPLRFVFPCAPEIPVSINGGYVMPAWYDILGADLVAREDEAGLRSSGRALNALIDREKSRGIPARRIVLAGFSQGCAMALLTGLRHEERLAGIAGLSGYLPLAAQTPAERHPANKDVPIFLAHGSHDDVVPLARAMQTRDALEAMGYAPAWHQYPMAHSVCPQEIVDLSAWLQQVLR